jgi:hypothetical protein
MIQKYVEDLALQMGIHLSQALFVDGRKLGCLNTHLLNLDADGHRVSTLVYQTEIDELQSGLSCKPLEDNIRAALSRLKTLLES